MPLNPLALLTIQRNPALAGLLGRQDPNIQPVRSPVPPVGPGMLMGRPTPPPGLLSPSVAPPAPRGAPAAQGGGLRGFLGDITSGADDPNLTPEQNQRARRMGSLKAGLSIIAGANREPGTGHPLANLAAGLLAGQGAGEEFRANLFTQARQVAADKQSGEMAALQMEGQRIGLMREQARNATLGDRDLRNPEVRQDVILELANRGDLEGVQMMQNIDGVLRDTAVEDQGKALREQLTEGLDYSDPRAVAAVAGRLAGSGFGVEAQALNQTAALMLQIKDAYGIQSYQNVGDRVVGLDADGKEVMSLEVGESPELMAANARHFQTQQLALAQAVNDDQRQAITSLGDDFHNRSSTAQAAGMWYQMGLEAPDNSIGHYTLINVYSKLIDPDTAIREGETQNVRETAPWLERFLDPDGRIINGVLPPEAAQRLRGEINRLAQEQKATFESTIVEPMLRQANAMGVNPDLFMFNPFDRSQRYAGQASMAAPAQAPSTLPRGN